VKSDNAATTAKIQKHLLSEIEFEIAYTPNGLQLSKVSAALQLNGPLIEFPNTGKPVFELAGKGGFGIEAGEVDTTKKYGGFAVSVAFKFGLEAKIYTGFVYELDIFPGIVQSAKHDLIKNEAS
jgi:hypothetical protein